MGDSLEMQVFDTSVMQTLGMHQQISVQNPNECRCSAKPMVLAFALHHGLWGFLVPSKSRAASLQADELASKLHPYCFLYFFTS